MASFTDTFPTFMSLTLLAAAMKMQNICIQLMDKSIETLRY